MRVYVRNLGATVVIINGLPDGGRIAAGAEENFLVSSYGLSGRDSTTAATFATIRRMSNEGRIRYEVDLDQNDYDVQGRKLLRVSFADGHFTAVALNQTWVHARAFPVGARHVVGRTNTVTLIANPNFDGGDETSLLDVGIAANTTLFVANREVGAVAGALGQNPLNAVANLGGFDLGGTVLQARIDQTAGVGGGAPNISLNTAGEIEIEVLYTIA